MSVQTVLMERLVVAIQLTIVFRRVLKRRTGAMEILTALISQMNIRVVCKVVLLLMLFYFIRVRGYCV